MTAGKDDRPLLILRKTRGNRYTLPVLLGCIETEELTRSFRVLIADRLEDITSGVNSSTAIVGFSFVTPQLEAVKEEVDRLRRYVGKDTILLAGGAHATADPEGTLALGFDFVFAGQGEETWPSFLRNYLAGRKPPAPILRGPKNSGMFTRYPPHSLEQRFFSPVEITRGCMYGCSFCQTPRIFGNSLHHRTPASVAGYLARTVPFGYRQTAFISSNAFSYGSEAAGKINLAAIEELLAGCNRSGMEGTRFGCYPSEVRPDWVSPEVLELVKKYCLNKTIVLGAQSGSNSLLAGLRRGHTAEQSLQAAHWICAAGFTPHVDFVFGFPGETLGDRRLSLELMETLIREYGARIHAHTYMPLPGTPLFPLEPTRLDGGTKNALCSWEEKGKLDGWWKEQEVAAWKIVAWRDQGMIRQRGEAATNTTKDTIDTKDTGLKNRTLELKHCQAKEPGSVAE